MIKAVLFDMDGVLIDSKMAWFHLMNAMAEHFGREKFTKEYFITEMWGITSHDAAERYFSNLDFDQVDDFIKANLLHYVKKIYPMPGVKEMLVELRKKPLKIATVTNTPTKLTSSLLERFGILQYFDLIMARDLVPNPKPEPDMIFKACEELGIDISEAVFIGDTMVDKIASEKAGCPFIGYKLDSEKRIESLKELLKHV